MCSQLLASQGVLVLDDLAGLPEWRALPLHPAVVSTLHVLLEAEGA